MQYNKELYIGQLHQEWFARNFEKMEKKQRKTRYGDQEWWHPIAPNIQTSEE